MARDYSLTEASKALGVDRRTIGELIRVRKLPSRKRGQMTVVSVATFRELKRLLSPMNTR